MRKKMGAKNLFNTAHRVAHSDIAAISRVLKYAILVSPVTRLLKIVILKVFEYFGASSERRMA